MFVSERDDPMSAKDGSRANSGRNSKDKQAHRPPAADRPFAEYLCFAIYSANLAYGRAYKQGLAELGLTYPQWIAIVVLGEQGEQTVSELGDRMFLESNTLTPMLKKLEAMGYLRRQRNPADERQVRVGLTDAGRRLREKGMHMTLVKSAGLKPDEFERLQKSVVTLRDSLIKATEGE
jgi:MarR family transcriptional regulator, organic hydroperoxide resistance regulator